MTTIERPSPATSPLLRSPGSMTAHMRAVSLPAGPRVLRVAALAGGRIVEERTLERRQRVTVGATEDCTFVVPGHAGRHVVLFEPAGSGWKLRLAEGMTGRVALEDGVVELGSLRGGSSVPLTDDARGRVSLGKATFLFQLAPQLPRPPRPQLPLSVKQGLGAQIDWSLTVLVALSFLLHFGLVGGMYSDWMDPTVDAEFTAQLALVPSPTTPPPVETLDDTSTSPATSASAVASSDPRRPHAPRPDVHPAPAPVSDVDALVHEWQRVGISTIGSLDVGPNAQRVLRRDDDQPPVDLDALARRSTGVDDRPYALGLPRETGPILARPGDDLTSLHPSQTAPIASTAGTVRPVVPFRMDGEPPRTSARIANAEAVIRTQLQPRARQCYQHAVTADPSLPDGSLVIAIQVGASGEVGSAGVTSRTGLSPQVAACIQGAASRLTFESPGAGGATVTVPFHFVKQ
jgi:hypothetical protein